MKCFYYHSNSVLIFLFCAAHAVQIASTAKIEVVGMFKFALTISAGAMFCARMSADVPSLVHFLYISTAVLLGLYGFAFSVMLDLVLFLDTVI